MFRSLMASAAAFFLSGAALAADLPMSEPPMEDTMAPAAAFSWTGFYIGLNAGFQTTVDGIVHNTGTDTGPGGLGTALAVGAIPTTVDLGDNGFTGGGQLGVNRQMGSVVFGLEGDFQWMDQGDSATFATTVLTPLTSRFRRDLEWLATVRGRVGFAPAERLLIYGTGGLAFGETSIENRAVAPAAFPPLNTSKTSSGVDLGWVAGAGGEFAVSDHLSIKGEALYYDLGNRSTTINYNYPGFTSSLTSKTLFDGVIARVGANWKW